MTTNSPLRRVRVFLLCEAAAFVIAALTHLGALLRGYEHRQARIAKSIIALVLLSGLTLGSNQHGLAKPP